MVFESNGPGCWVEEGKGDRWKLFRLCYSKTRKPRALKLQFTELRSREAAVAPNHSKTWDPKPYRPRSDSRALFLLLSSCTSFLYFLQFLPFFPSLTTDFPACYLVTVMKNISQGFHNRLFGVITGSSSTLPSTRSAGHLPRRTV